MKTRLLYTSIIATVSLVLITSVSINNHPKNKKLSAMIEALTSDEAVGGHDECGGLPAYKTVGLGTEKRQERIHVDDNYDMIITTTYQICTASGDGSLRGTNNEFPISSESESVKHDRFVCN